MEIEKKIYLLKDSKKRTLVKAIIWRLIATACTFLLLVIFGESLNKALIMAACDLFFKTLIYYIYERCFVKIKWGRKIKKINDLGKYTYDKLPEDIENMEEDIENLQEDIVPKENVQSEV
jgi:uncharacterized membrane protein